MQRCPSPPPIPSSTSSATLSAFERTQVRAEDAVDGVHDLVRSCPGGQATGGTRPRLPGSATTAALLCGCSGRARPGRCLAPLGPTPVPRPPPTLAQPGLPPTGRAAGLRPHQVARARSAVSGTPSSSSAARAGWGILSTSCPGPHSNPGRSVLRPSGRNSDQRASTRRVIRAISWLYPPLGKHYAAYLALWPSDKHVLCEAVLPAVRVGSRLRVRQHCPRLYEAVLRRVVAHDRQIWGTS